MLSSGFAEAHTKTIMLLEDDFQGVKYFINWIYSGVFSYEVVADKRFRTIWLFADKSCEEAYCNDVMDSMLEYYCAKQGRLFKEKLTHLYNIGMGESQVAKFGVKGTVNAMMMYPYTWRTRQQAFFDTIKEGGEGSSELMVAILEEILLQRSEPESEHDPLEMQGCHFHRHIDGSPCSKENEMG
jgi:hypothetical protein